MGWAKPDKIMKLYLAELRIPEIYIKKFGPAEISVFDMPHNCCHFLSSSEARPLMETTRMATTQGYYPTDSPHRRHDGTYHPHNWHAA